MEPPNYSQLRADPNWIALWHAGESPLVEEIARLENLLHDPRVEDHIRILGVKHRLAALRWLRDTVEKLADLPAAQEAPAASPGLLRRAADMVLPARLG